MVYSSFWWFMMVLWWFCRVWGGFVGFLESVIGFYSLIPSVSLVKKSNELVGFSSF